MSSMLGKYGVKLKFKYETRPAKSEGCHSCGGGLSFPAQAVHPNLFVCLLLKPFFIGIGCISKQPGTLHGYAAN